MTRKIGKQERAMRRLNYKLRLLVNATSRSNSTFREASENLRRFVLAWDGKEPAWPQFNHEKEKPERSRMHAMYGRRRNK